MIRAFQGVEPKIESGAFIAANATVIGKVVIGSGSSIWYQSVLRGDVGTITIGSRTNIQDLTMVHVTTNQHDTWIGDDVTVGHGAMLHGCRLENGSFVGMRATVMDGAVVETGALVAAGALIPPGMVVPAGHLAVGSPARVVRPLRESEVDMVRRSAPHYAALAEEHLRLSSG